MEYDLNRLILQISDALEGMHNNGVVHLDIKPENILLKDNNFYLNDFEYSKNLNLVND